MPESVCACRPGVSSDRVSDVAGLDYQFLIWKCLFKNGKKGIFNY